MKANETAAMYVSKKMAQEDRELFVKNLGYLLSQTREWIERCYLDDGELVHIVFKKSSQEKIVNVNMDSYMAIIRDVTKHL